MAAWPHHLSYGVTMERLRHLSTQSSANRHNQLTQACCSHTEREKKEIDCRLYSLPLKPRLLSNIHPPKVCHLIQCSSADTARWWDFLFLSFSLFPSHIYTHSPPAQCVAVAQKLMSWNECSVTSAALCQSGFISLRRTHESLRFNRLSGPCQLQSLACIFNEAAFVCV